MTGCFKINGSGFKSWSCSGLSVCWLSLSGSVRLSVQQEEVVWPECLLVQSVRFCEAFSSAGKKGVWPECLLAQSVRFCEAFSSAGRACMA